ncbi:hypothetical protein INS49_001033 [Diaporthe citri]|uniref:uncharacterized protein n=1 Tax=Diaporthe citri TaxID=83186 RepID=UPI001C7E9D6F|nr:uncharacterized protein INS49_001033 [Diaporthe citri]KAG6366852.1 hypothetical protein INS49_001033 [Diaporthe citri]
MSSRHRRSSKYRDSVAGQPSERVHEIGSEGSSAWPHHGAPSSSYYASAGGQQTGFAYEIGQDHVGPLSSRSQHQVVAELNATNLARVNEQPLVRGPLKQLEDASEQTTLSVHDVYKEIDQLNTSILSYQNTVNTLREQITAAKSAEQWTQVQWLETHEANTQERIQQEEQRRQDLLGRLEQKGRFVDGALRAHGLETTHAGWQSNYPTRADMAEDTKGVPEEARPHLDF